MRSTRRGGGDDAEGACLVAIAIFSHLPGGDGLKGGTWAGKIQVKLEPYLARVFELRRRIATVAVAVLAVWLFMHVTFGANGMVVYRAKRAEYQRVQKDIQQLQKENQQYASQVEQLKTDPKRIEKEAREQFHYARPGEVIYVAPQHAAPLAPGNRSASK